MTKYCQICGVEIPNGQDFCLSCCSKEKSVYKKFRDISRYNLYSNPSLKAGRKNQNKRKENMDDFD